MTLSGFPCVRPLPPSGRPSLCPGLPRLDPAPSLYALIFPLSRPPFRQQGMPVILRAVLNRSLKSGWGTGPARRTEIGLRVHPWIFLVRRWFLWDIGEGGIKTRGAFHFFLELFISIVMIHGHSTSNFMYTSYGRSHGRFQSSPYKYDPPNDMRLIVQFFSCWEVFKVDIGIQAIYD